MPDARDAHDFAGLESRCKVLPPGFDPPPGTGLAADFPPRPPTSPGRGETLAVGWVSRWEHDKRPDRFVDLVARLEQHGIDFQLVLLGPRPAQVPDALGELRDRFGGCIVHDAFAETKGEYWSRLGEMDVVVSTSDHEFFGIAVCEAIWAGAVPVLPNRLSYPELAPKECLYDSLDDAVRFIDRLRDPAVRHRVVDASRAMVRRLRMEYTVARMDDALCRLKSDGALRDSRRE